MTHAAPTPASKNVVKRTKAPGKSQAKTKGWTTARRLAQAHRLRQAQIWLKSTGPRTQAGKMRASLNARKTNPQFVKNQAINTFLRAQNLYRRLWVEWCKNRTLDNAKKSRISALLQVKESDEKTGFLLGVLGEKLIRFGLQILEENNG